MKVLLGVDSGGSHTRAICVDGTGRYLGGAMSGGGRISSLWTAWTARASW